MSALGRKRRRDLRARRGALLSLILLGALGSACLLGLAGAHRDLERARDRLFQRGRMSDFQVEVTRLPETSLPGLEATPGVRLLEGRVRAQARVHLPGSHEPLSATVLSLPLRPGPALHELTVTSGSWPEGPDPDRALVLDAFARARGVKPGDPLEVTLEGRRIRLKVAGTVRSPEFIYVLPPGGGFVPDPGRAPVLFLPLRTLQAWTDRPGQFNELLGLLESPGGPGWRAPLDALEERLEPFGATSTTPRADQPSVAFLEGELTELKITATGIPGLCLGVTGLLMNLIMRRLVGSERGVIGTLRSLGYSAGALARHYLGHGLLVGCAASVLGLALGLAMRSWLIRLYGEFFDLPGLEAGLEPDLLLLTGLSAPLTCALGSLLAALEAAGLPPALSLRPPAPPQGRRILLEALPWLWGSLATPTRLAARSLVRNPARSLTQLMTSCAATAMLLQTLCMWASLEFLIEHEFQRTSRQDLALTLTRPLPREVLEEIRRLPGITALEPQLGIPAELSAGSRRERAMVLGILDPPRLHTPLDRQGALLRPSTQGLVLSLPLARRLDLQAGDPVQVRGLEGARREALLQVTGIADSYVGLGAWGRIETVAGLMGEPWATDRVLARIRTDRPSAALWAELTRSPYLLGVESRLETRERLLELLEGSLGTSLTIMVGLAGLLALGSLVNTALVNLSERSRETALFRALGFTPGEVGRVFLLEALWLHGLGVAAGLPAGIGLVHLITRAYERELLRLPRVIPPEALVWTTALMGLSLVLAQLHLGREIRRQRWLEALGCRE